MTAVRERPRAAEHRAPRRRRDRRKVLAIASAFSVLGVGAGVTTLAAWTENIPLAGASVGASSFCVETNINGVGWVQEAVTSGVPASIPISFSAASALSPGGSAYALVQIAMCPGSVAGTTVTIAGSAANTGPFLTALNYGLNAISGTTCNVAAFGGGTSYVAATTALTSTAAAPLPALPVNTATGGNPPTAPINLCFQVGLPAGSSLSLQNTSGTPSWTLSVSSS